MTTKQSPPVHPGKVLEEQFLKPQGLSQHRLALDIGVDPRRINEIVLGKRSVTANTALRLARYLGTSAGFWLGLQMQYDLDVEEDALGARLQREVRIGERSAARLGLTSKTSVEVDALLAELREALEGIYGDRLHKLYLFGSYARGDARPGSDVDVLVVLDRVDSYGDEIKRTSRARADIALEHDVSISLVYVSISDWEKSKEPLLFRVRREGKAA